MTSVRFFHSVLAGLIAATFLSGAMMVAMAMTADPSGYERVH